jgi:hypothetical protein
VSHTPLAEQLNAHDVFELDVGALALQAGDPGGEVEQRAFEHGDD